MDDPPRVALITGVGSGIGRATADAFLAAGFRVTALDRNLDPVQGWGDEQQSERAAAVQCDIRHAAEVATATVNRSGGIDVLVNNAGVQIDGTVETLSEDTWQQVVDTNLTGTFLCSTYAIPHLRLRKDAIVNTGSPIGRLYKSGVGCYAATKARVEALTRVMALELAADGTRVNRILPGSTDTPLVWAKVPEAERPAKKALAAEEQPIGRIAEPSEIADVTLFLASPAARFMTGSSVVVDGGMLCRIGSKY